MIAADISSRSGYQSSEQFLASDAAGWVTAQNIRVNGGTA